jgi:Flp pilus assembly protein TadD
MTRRLWLSAFTAAVFAIHPLRVESVAWITERKDVLCGALSLLTIAAYLGYTRRRSGGRYLVVLALFGAALMAKSMAVTLPFVLLLLDFWPLGRLSSPPATLEGSEDPSGAHPEKLRALLWEKLPLLLLSGAAAVLQITTASGMIRSLEAAPFLSRVGNALVSYTIYLGESVYPAGLCIFYPLPATGLPWWQPVLAFLLLAGVSALVFFSRKRRPYLLVGWLWFLGTLVPVIGLVQSGALARADRYTYFPQIGLCMAVVWLVDDWRKDAAWKTKLAGVLALAAVAALALGSRQQVSYWRDSETLWRHDLACAEESFDAEVGLGEALLDGGRYPEAGVCFEKALRFHPDSDRTQNQLGIALAKQKRVDEAITHFRAALAINSETPEVHRNLGLMLVDKGDLAEAVAQLRIAVSSYPRDVASHAHLAEACLKLGRTDEALEHYRAAVQITPGSAAYHLGLAEALAAGQQIGAGAAELRAVLAIDPESVLASAKLAWILATSPDPLLRDGHQAVELARKAAQGPGAPNPAVLRILAAAYAEDVRFSEAIAAAEQAMALATAKGNAALAQQLKSELALYQAHQAFRAE